MVINAGVRPSQSAGTGDWARGAPRAVAGGGARWHRAILDGADGWDVALGCGWGGECVLDELFEWIGGVVKGK